MLDGKPAGVDLTLEYQFYSWRKMMNVGWVDPHSVPWNVVERDLTYSSLEAELRANKQQAATENANAGIGQ